MIDASTALLFGAVGLGSVSLPLFAHFIGKAAELYRRGRRTAYERHLDEVADEVCRRAQDAARERFGRFGR